MKKRITLLLAVLLALSGVPAFATSILLNGVTAIGVGSAIVISRDASNQSSPAYRTYQATVVGTGSVSATVAVQASNDGIGWVTIGTITLSGTTTATDGFASAAPWLEVRGNVTAISGTGAAVALTVEAQ